MAKKTYLGSVEIEVELDDMGMLIISALSSVDGGIKRQYIDTGMFNKNYLNTESEHINPTKHVLRLPVMAVRNKDA